MPVDQALAFKAALTAAKQAYKAFKKYATEKQHDTLLSQAIRELLKLSPNVTAAEAKILAAEALGLAPNENLLHAKKIHARVKAHRRRRKKATRRKKSRGTISGRGKTKATRRKKKATHRKKKKATRRKKKATRRKR